MKILLIDVNCKNSSTGKIVYDLYGQLMSNGHEAAICYGRGPKINERNIFKFGIDLETYFHALLTRITGYTGCFSYFSTKRLIRFIKKFKPDVVHIHELHAYFININALLNYLKKQNIKVVHTLHCAFSYTGKCGHHLDCNKWKTVCNNCPKIKEYVSTVFFDQTKKMFLKKKRAFTGFNDMTIVCPSNWLASFARESFLGQYPIKVINNGINTTIFYPRDTKNKRKELSILLDEKVVVSVAPNLMSNSKGGAFVLEIAKKARDLRWKFILVGVNESKINVPENVILLPKISNQNELAELYSLADAFVICSKMENLPTTCLEAQCCGTPVCGFDVGGTKETSVLEGDFFVEYGNLEKLFQVLNMLIISKTSKSEISALATKKFDKKVFFSEYLKVYSV